MAVCWQMWARHAHDRFKDACRTFPWPPFQSDRRVNVAPTCCCPTDGGILLRQTGALLLAAAAPQMFGLLAERADEVLEQFTPQGLANLAWGLTVAACYPPQVGGGHAT